MVEVRSRRWQQMAVEDAFIVEARIKSRPQRCSLYPWSEIFPIKESLTRSRKKRKEIRTCGFWFGLLTAGKRKQKKQELCFLDRWKRTLDRNGLDRKRLGLSQTRQGDDSGGRLWICHRKMERVTEVTGENEKKRSVKAGGFGFVSFCRWKKTGKAGCFVFLIGGRRLSFHKSVRRKTDSGDKQHPGMEDFGRDRGVGWVSGKSRDLVITLDVTKVEVGCPGKVKNRVGSKRKWLNAAVSEKCE